MDVAWFVGPPLPSNQMDGVDDYTRVLGAHIEAPNIHIIRIMVPKATLVAWAVAAWSAFSQYGIIQLQYPSESWRNSLSPIMGIMFAAVWHPKARIVLTLHEWSRLHLLRRVSISCLLPVVSYLIFTVEKERIEFTNATPAFFQRPSSVIGIGSNLPAMRVPPRVRAETRRHLLEDGKYDRLVVYFGVLYKDKQPNKMVDAMQVLVSLGYKWRLVIVGDFSWDRSRDRSAFHRYVSERGMEQHIRILGSLEPLEVNRIMAACDATLFLYADGVSMRRSTFLYAYDMGVPIVTTGGALPEQLTNTENVYLVPADAQPQTIARALLEASEKPHVERRSEQDPWEMASQAYQSIYLQVCREVSSDRG